MPARKGNELRKRMLRQLRDPVYFSGNFADPIDQEEKARSTRNTRSMYWANTATAPCKPRGE